MKLVTEGKDIVKPVLAIVAKLIGNRDVENKFKEISLSHNSMTKQTNDLAANIKEQIILHSIGCCFYALALDESTDVCGVAQLAIFIRAINNNFKLIEELIGLESLKETTKGADIFEALKQFILRKQLDWSKLVSVCTDGASAMIGNRNIGIGLLISFLGRSVLKYHCIIHQEVLCGQNLNMQSVMDVVVKGVNKIRARVLNRREFKQYLQNLDAQYGELLRHSDVRWLSTGKVLARFWILKTCASVFKRNR